MPRSGLPKPRSHRELIKHVQDLTVERDRSGEGYNRNSKAVEGVYKSTSVENGALQSHQEQDVPLKLTKGQEENSSRRPSVDLQQH